MGGIDEDGMISHLFDDIPEFANSSGNYSGGKSSIYSKNETNKNLESTMENNSENVGIELGNQLEKDEFQYGGDETHFPPSIKFILGNEIGERYSYFAMKSILNNYLIMFMGYNSKTAETIGHIFNASAYFFTLFGAYIADARLGKFKTILLFSVVYCFGAGIFSITAIPGVTGSGPGSRSPWGLILGLGGIAIGTGGIKPLISSFCGDQFGPHQKKLLTSLFQVFYWCVNLGSFFSSILSPILRTQVGYWIAFLIPSIILMISIAIFICGTKKFIKRKPQGSVFSTFLKIIICGIQEKIKYLKATDDQPYEDIYYQDSYLDRAKLKFSSQSVDQVKQVLRVLLVFTPLPFFWALYDQTGTRWTTQGNIMNRRIGSITMDTEIIGALNPLLILIFVPIFEYGLYRPIAKRGINFSPLRRMAAGMVLSVIAFYIAAFVQLAIDNSPPNSVHIALQIPQYVVLTWGEILLSITGLEFAYANSPRSMKSIVMAGWLISVSIGNLFDAFVIGLIKASEFILYILFGSVMLVFIFIFVFIAYYFKPIDPSVLDALNGQPPTNIDELNSIEIDQQKLDNEIVQQQQQQEEEQEEEQHKKQQQEKSIISSKNSSPRPLKSNSLNGSTKLRKSKGFKKGDYENNIDDIDIPTSSSMCRRNTSNNNSLNNSKGNEISTNSDEIVNNNINNNDNNNEELQEIDIDTSSQYTINSNKSNAK
ncbi:hypothetical protein ACTFIR_012516 [Dictyostelium discoideum]